MLQQLYNAAGHFKPLCQQNGNITLPSLPLWQSEPQDRQTGGQTHEHTDTDTDTHTDTHTHTHTHRHTERRPALHLTGSLQSRHEPSTEALLFQQEALLCLLYLHIYRMFSTVVAVVYFEMF